MKSKKVTLKLEGISEAEIGTTLDALERSSFEITTEPLFDIEISHRGISLYPDWSLTSIPLIYSQYIPLTSTNLKLVVNLRLENRDAIDANSLPKETIFKHNSEIEKNILTNQLVYDSIYDNYIENSQFEEYAITHNKAIIAYFNWNKIGSDPDLIEDAFKHAAYLAPNATWLAYTNFLFLVFLLENNKVGEAIAVANQITRRDLPDFIKAMALLTIYKLLTLSELALNYSQEIQEVDEALQAVLSNPKVSYDYYLAKSFFLETKSEYKAAQDVLDTALKNTEEGSYFQANGYAIKGNLYIKMAQTGSTHFYTNSLQCYHQALKTLNKQEYPEDYANCQMNIGIIYAEMPSVENKKHIYAGLSQTAFNEALEIFNRFDNPLNYASVCTNFGNSLMRFLPFIDDERFDKISYYFREAIDVRTIFQLDEEKASSMMGLLNLYFYRIESVEEVDFVWFSEMEALAKEILEISENEYLIQMAREAMDFVNQKN